MTLVHLCLNTDGTAETNTLLGHSSCLLCNDVGRRPVTLSPLQLSGISVMPPQYNNKNGDGTVAFQFGRVCTSTLSNTDFSPCGPGRIDTTSLLSFHWSSYTLCAVTCLNITFVRPSSSSWHDINRAKPHRTDSKAGCPTKSALLLSLSPK